MGLLKSITRGGYGILKDDANGRFGWPITIVTATKTLLKSEIGVVVVRSTAACTLTLPEVEKGLWFLIINAVDQNLTLAAPTADTLVAFNDVAADSIDFDQAGNKIGGVMLAVCDGTAWIAGGLTAHTEGVNT